MKSSMTRTGACLPRRRVLKGMSVLLALPSLSGLARDAGGPRNGTGCRRRSPRLEAPPSAPAMTTGSATGFSAEEAHMLVRLAETIVPSDATPGAKETNSGAFVVFSLQNEGADTVAGIRQALAALNGLALGQFGDQFNNLPQAAVDALAGVLAGEAAFAPFWNGVRSLTVFHHYAMPAGYRPIGLPGPNIDRGGFPRPHLIPCLLPG